LVDGLFEVQFEYVRGRMNVLRDVRRDLGAAVYFEAPHLRACIAPGTPNPAFNQVYVSGPVALADLERALESFEVHGMTPCLQLGPGSISSDVARFLDQRGFVHTQSDPVLIHQPGTEPAVRTLGFSVRRVQSGGELEAFKEAYLRAWQVGEWLAPTLLTYIERWPDVEGWSLYLARERDVPSGVAILYERGGVAYLADAATVPELRGRGAQGSLIAQRVALAYRGGAKLVFSRAEFGSTSQRNLERGGLMSRFTVALWNKR
jgi:hypothetical protein